MKYSDRPVQRPREDVLGRASFSLSLATAIDQLALARDGFVISVVGEWGAGKSSVIELSLRFLTHLEMERASHGALPGDIEASPKNLQELEELAEAFDEIRDRVMAFDSLNLDFPVAQRNYRLNLFKSWMRDDEAARKADLYWRLLCKVEARRRNIIVRFSPWLIAGRTELASALLSELARSLGDKLGTDVRKAFAGLLERLSELGPLAGAGLDLSTGYSAGKALSSGLTWASKRMSEAVTGPTLDNLRESLKSKLRNLSEQRIIVVVDDLDRLTPPEAVEMVSLIKSLGDLPNVIYLLSYDARNLASLIKKALKLNGDDFLEKIVQYKVHLPPISGDALTELINADLGSLLGELSDADQRRLSSAWHFAMRRYLKTPRDVRLYVNSVAVALSSQRDHVDVVDMLLLELLRLHEPNVYDWVRDNLDELTQ